MKLILVIDVGTSSMRGILYNFDGEIKNIKQVLYKPTFLKNNYVEQDPSSWEEALIKITSESVDWGKKYGATIEALSITAQRSSIIPVNKVGEPLQNAIMWQDKRTFNICEELEKYANLIYSCTGSKVNTVFGAPKMKWIKQNQPDLYNHTYKMLTIADYLIFIMTGNFVTDYTYGSRSLIMNVLTLKWDNEMLELFDVDKDKLCDLVPQGTVVGITTSEFQCRTGLTNGTPVISAGGDQQCAALGAGIIENGSMNITTGTGSFIQTASDNLNLDIQHRTTCNVSAIPGKYIIESSVLTTSSICNWFSKNFYDCEEKDETLLYVRMIEEAQSSPVGSNNVIALPYFQGRGSPDWNTLATGMFFNVSLQTTRGDFARSILEGIAMEISENIDVITETVGEIDSISVSGGLTKSHLFNQIQADVYNKKIMLPGNKETTSLGAWISAAVTLGIYGTYNAAYNKAEIESDKIIYSPVSDNTKIYNGLILHKKKMYNVLKQGGIYQTLQ
ncbi:FGGY-family carbohydrate kinase [Bacillus sp. Marseille-P3661]|uniref:FGGY-family carbohydrate kinase n=1 Tax=Bacillus sp. Marseille-P3661 TaxID=1936234 RepID=UPI000C8588AF|nr:FGGY-family carbohydrate kinase [Bacillus sp. Marseille-P3661]